MRIEIIALVLALAAIPTHQAVATCKDDIDAFEQKLAAAEPVFGKQVISESDRATGKRSDIQAAKKWIAKAISAEPTSEIECLNDLSRAQNALTAPRQSPR